MLKTITRYSKIVEKRLKNFSHILPASGVYIVKGLSNRKITDKGDEGLDREDYERIVRTHMDTIYRIAVSYTKTPADADDIVQQTFVKLLSKKETFADEEHEKRWLIRVCINECNSFFSSFWRRNVDSMDTLTTEPQFTTRENTDLYDAIKSLPSKCSIVVYLFYYEGYSTKEIGKLLHIKEATVRTRLVRARKLLKEQLREAW